MASTKNQRKAARRAARRGEPASKEKPPVQNRAMQTLEALAFAKDDTRFLEAPAPCPYCGAPLQTTHSLEQGGARPGAFTICTKCGSLSQFDEQLKLKAVSDAEIESFPPEFRAHIEDLQGLVRHVKLSRGARKSTVDA